MEGGETFVHATTVAQDGRAGSGRRVAWIATISVAAGIIALLALVVIASLTPEGAEAGLPAATSAALRVTANDLELRSAGVLIFIAAAVALFVFSARPRRVLARSDRRPVSRARH